METSNAELLRVHAVAYQGRRARLCLAVNSAGLTVNSTTAQWDAAEITSQAANGYARVEWTMPAAAYSNALGMAQGNGYLATFQATPSGLGMNFTHAYLVYGNGTTWDTNIANLWPLEPGDQVLSQGQPISFEVISLVDNIATVS